MLRADGAHRPPFVRARRGGRRSSRHDHGLRGDRCAHRLDRGLDRHRCGHRGRPRDPARRVRRLPPLPGVLHVRSGILSTPRPIPNRIWPAVAAAIFIALALPVYLVAGWPLSGWVLAAVLWILGEALAFALARLPVGLDNLAASGMVAIGMTVRVIGVMVVLIAVTVADKRL